MQKKRHSLDHAYIFAARDSGVLAARVDHAARGERYVLEIKRRRSQDERMPEWRAASEQRVTRR